MRHDTHDTIDCCAVLWQVNTVTIKSPTTTVSGDAATFSASVTAFASPVMYAVVVVGVGLRDGGAGVGAWHMSLSFFCRSWVSACTMEGKRVMGVYCALRFSIVNPSGVSTVVGTLTEPTLPDSTGGGLYQIFVNVSGFPTSDGYGVEYEAYGCCDVVPCKLTWVLCVLIGNTCRV